ncbi:MAG: AmpG family muropeptide MFS transporter [Rhodospirillales bacterium]|jgi:PAT family beta-lactamase induction signal transducer AmpG|nr:AmpG family muropeptide MFS transporter [Rhodospirillales bacterium]MBT3904757.1 AmpG family muropeptide MFS transporter [Rhodospirillaceae bacterium]MBT5035229.1 AmpG family muropeptide MFS transporter [Rhodospirillaceae bacterium]MBT6221592.1 AmpG family muropeptide MFS transporter [Rhodospirillaceae bacterium]MBT6361796.1 AmpG family muropeptide MFS transporter [Rhodospirillaceae bacterium]
MVQTWIASWSVYFERRVVALLFFGFSSGLPLLLVYSTLSAWLKDEGVSKTLIGLFSWASTAYALKFLWAPIVDRMPLPVLTQMLGQRRGWMVLSQLAIIGAILGLGATDPSEDLWPVAFWAVVLAFASATQDIGIDAYRIEILEDDQQGAGAANLVTGYRIALLVAGGGALIIADFWDWQVAYVAMSGLMVVGLATVLLNKEPNRPTSTESFTDAVIGPFFDFMSRPHWLMILLFVALYKYGDALLGVMANPFYREMGFSKTEIGLVSKGYGLVMTLIGGFLGGVLVARMDILKALMVCGILQALSNLAFAAQAWVGYSVPMLAVTISIENFTGGMATIAFIAYLSGLCNIAYTATQYALLSSLMAFARTIFASGGGWLADNMDWVTYFLVTTAAALPGLLLLLWLIRRFPPDKTKSEV